MSNILWVEDFGGGEVITTVDDVLGGILETGNLPNEKRKLRKILGNNGITLHINFQDAASFIKERLGTIDFVILDIDLDSHAKGKDITQDCPEIIKILKTYYDLTDTSDEAKLMDALSDLQKHAGFHLYVDLLFNHQYPREKILFCSNHGENLKTIQNAFKAAMMEMPPIYTKGDEKVKKLVQTRSKSKYATLRRAIIDGCDAIINVCEKMQRLQEQGGAQDDPIQFNSLINSKDRSKYFSLQDMQNYARVLAQLLPLQEPGKTEKANKLKLFVRTLSHEWEATIDWKNMPSNNDLRTFVNIMLATRNWITHTKQFDSISEEDVAYLFICNMRAMLDLGDKVQKHEKDLFTLFDTTEIDRNSLTVSMTKEYYKYSKEIRHDAISFRNLLTGGQRAGKARNVSLIQGLYHLFWFQTSPGMMRESAKPNELTYKFNIDPRYCVNPASGSFFSEFARHIYSKSFQD